MVSRELPRTEADANQYTGDGSVDYKSRPALRTKSGTWRAAPFLLAMMCLEMMANFSIVLNLPAYLTKYLFLEAPVAVQASNNLMGTSYLCPLLGGFFADAYFGRFRGTAVFAVVQILGSSYLTYTAGPKSRNPPMPNRAKLIANFVALYTLAVGGGGLRPCLTTFGADQFDEEDPKEKKLLSTFFNWSFFATIVGLFVAVTLLLRVQDREGFRTGFMVATVLLLSGLVVVVLGYPLYRYHSPRGSPLTRIAQVFVASFRNRKLSDGELYEIPPSTSLPGGEKFELLPHTNQFKWMDQAAMSQTLPEAASEKHIPTAWHLCTITQVEEAKIFVRMLPILLTTILLNTVAAQFTTWTILQGSTMERRLGHHFYIPPPSIAAVSLVLILLAIPLYDRCFVPLARRYTGCRTGISPLQRTGAGLVLATLSMLIGGFVEASRLEKARDYNLRNVDPRDPSKAIPLSIFWLVPMQVTFGMGEFLALVGLSEFYYSQAPRRMRTLALGISGTTTGLGYYLSSGLIDVVNFITGKNGHTKWLGDNINHGHLDYFYFLLCCLSFLNFLLFLIASKWYKYRADKDYKDTREAELTETEVEATTTTRNQISSPPVDHPSMPSLKDSEPVQAGSIQLSAPAAETSSPARPRNVLSPWPVRSEARREPFEDNAQNSMMYLDPSSPLSREGFPAKHSPARSPNVRSSPSLRSRLNEVVRSCADMESVFSPKHASMEQRTSRQEEGFLASPSQMRNGACWHLPGTGVATDSPAQSTHGDEDYTRNPEVTRFKAPDVYSSDDDSGSFHDFSFVSDHFERSNTRNRHLDAFMERNFSLKRQRGERVVSTA